MTYEKPQFDVVDQGRVRPLSTLDLNDPRYRALSHAIRAPHDGAAGEYYVIVPRHELTDHVLLMRDGYVVKYSVGDQQNTGADVDRCLHFLSVAPKLPARLTERAEELSEARIDALLDVMLDVDPFEPIEARIDAKNAEMRAEFLKDFQVLDSAGIHRLAGLKGTNTSQTVNAWRQKRRILGLPVQGKIAYPRFQFDADGQPFALMAGVLAELPDGFSPWQRAFWLVSPKEDLDGETPADAIRTGDERVINAAQSTSDLVAG